MLRTASFAFLALSLATFPSTADAQDGPGTARATLEHLFTQALKSGALDRVLGERFYRYDRIGREGPKDDQAEPDPELILIVKGEHDRELRSLALSFTLVNAKVRLEMTYTYGFDGALRALDVLVKQGRGEVQGHGTVSADGSLSLQINARGQVQTQNVAWHDDALPELMALVVLPILSDQGLPNELTYYAFEGEDLRLNDSKTTTIRRAAAPATSALGPAEAFTFHEGEREMGHTLVSSRAADRGTLALIELDGRKRITPISAGDGAVWLDRFGAE